MLARINSIFCILLLFKGASSSHNVSQLACSRISQELPGEVYYSGSSDYSNSLASYFSLQEQELSPSCIVQPKTSSDVAKTVSIMRGFLKQGVQVAVRGGGHTSFSGAANINHGVTIDLGLLSKVDVSPDQKTVSIGPGARFFQVWQVLDPLKLSITGGRDSDVGVGGYMLGGGLSYLGPLLGWACDNVVEYELVLASGRIVTVNEQAYPDLFMALKGGSNNFGIVTSFTMKTYPLGKFWGGFIAYESTAATQQVDAFSRFMGVEPYDPHAAMIQTYGFTAGVSIISNGLAYTKPVTYPAVFTDFVDNTTTISNDLRIDTMASFANETDSYQSYNQRQIWYTTTFAHSPKVYSTIYSLWNSSLAGISDIDGINWYFTLQPTPALNNTNSLGLNPADKRLCIAMITAWYTNAADDDSVSAAVKKLFASIDAATKAAGVYRPFKYLNYADGSQAVIASYGPRSNAYLKSGYYTTQFKQHFQDGVVAHINRILPYSQKRLKSLEARKGMFGDDEP
ncbi:FAD-binding domain-containing protein [Aspergillus caelatus]|uniref:FAD-binding domain-containing protein n=1 Tax=Aspergillus caelatus TaxID=61420 RepID=A0A5N7APF5_9EURO|nr:FAD-binding domain-containing protein [Aspergillus caelatus]KAE8370878.1 FAD-binding domain-containing protein [Aspergillus caelatus]